MKNLLLVITVLGSLNTWAKDSQRVILSDSKTFENIVSEETVRCSEVGYGVKELKINLAALDGWTLFDHSNAQVGEFGEPCMTAGRCQGPGAPSGLKLEDLIKGNPGKEIVKVDREVIEWKTEAQHFNGTESCNRSLTENLTTTIRGIKFRHSRSSQTESFPIEACRKQFAVRTFTAF